MLLRVWSKNVKRRHAETRSFIRMKNSTLYIFEPGRTREAYQQRSHTRQQEELCLRLGGVLEAGKTLQSSVYAGRAHEKTHRRKTSQVHRKCARSFLPQSNRELLPFLRQLITRRNPQRVKTLTKLASRKSYIAQNCVEFEINRKIIQSHTQISIFIYIYFFNPVPKLT